MKLNLCGTVSRKLRARQTFMEHLFHAEHVCNSSADFLLRMSPLGHHFTRHQSLLFLLNTQVIITSYGTMDLIMLWLHKHTHAHDYG